MKRLKRYDLDITEDGKVYYNGRLLRQYKVSKGYRQVCINNKKLYVHKLVAEAYVHNPRPVRNNRVEFLDKNPANCHKDNLQWSNVHDINKKVAKRTNQGRSTSPISEEEAQKIVKRLENGEYAAQICKEYGVSDMSIARIRKRYGLKSPAVKYPKDVREVAFKMLETKTAKEVAKITGLPYHTVWRWSKK